MSILFRQRSSGTKLQSPEVRQYFDTQEVTTG